MLPRVTPGSQSEAAGRLALAALVVVLLPALPFGTFLAYPFLILTTWFHEMGHGLAAMALGQEFERLMIFASGSGVAQYRLAEDTSPLVRAAIAAGGPLAPSLVGAGLIVASAHPRAWRAVLWLVSAAILASTIIWVRAPVGYAVLPLLAALLALVAWRARPAALRFTLQFLGVLAALSMLRDAGYLLSASAVIDGKTFLSDTGQIAAALGLPHWFWAGLIVVLGGLITGLALRYALAEHRLRPPPPRRPANVLQFRARRRR